MKNGLEVSGSISMPFGSPWEGLIPIDDVEEIVEAYIGVGIKEISLSDAAGVATPKQVYDMCCSMQKKYPHVKWWLHFHNTRGMAMANILTAMEAGLQILIQPWEARRMSLCSRSSRQYFFGRCCSHDG